MTRMLTAYEVGALERLAKRRAAEQAACLPPGDQRGQQEDRCFEECCVCKVDHAHTTSCGNADYVAGCVEAFCPDHLPFTHEKCGRSFCTSHQIFEAEGGEYDYLFAGKPCIKNDPAEGLPICLACAEFFDQITPTAAQVAHLNRLRLSWGMLPLDAEVAGCEDCEDDHYDDDYDDQDGDLVMELCGEAAKGAARGFGHTTGEFAALAVFKIGLLIAAFYGLC